MQHQSHTVNRMPIHLPNEHTVCFEEGQEAEAVEKNFPEKSMLYQYFELNKRDPEVKKMLYTEVGENYLFVNKEFQKRKEYLFAYLYLCCIND